MYCSLRMNQQNTKMASMGMEGDAQQIDMERYGEMKRYEEFCNMAVAAVQVEEEDEEEIVMAQVEVDDGAADRDVGYGALLDHIKEIKGMVGMKAPTEEDSGWNAIMSALAVNSPSTLDVE